MDIYLYVSDNRVTGLSNTYSPGSVKVRVSKSHEVRKNPMVFRYENGQLIKDTLYQQKKMEEEKQSEQPSLQQQIENLKKQNSDLAFALMLKGVL